MFILIPPNDSNETFTSTHFNTCLTILITLTCIVGALLLFLCLYDLRENVKYTYRFLVYKKANCKIYKRYFKNAANKGRIYSKYHVTINNRVVGVFDKKAVALDYIKDYLKKERKKYERKY